MVIRTQGFQRQSDGKGCIPLTPLELEERWACLATFFLALGLVEIAAGAPGTCSWRVQAEWVPAGLRLVSPAEGTSALALFHFQQLHRCACMNRHALGLDEVCAGYAWNLLS